MGPPYAVDVLLYENQKIILSLKLTFSTAKHVPIDGESGWNAPA